MTLKKIKNYWNDRDKLYRFTVKGTYIGVGLGFLSVITPSFLEPEKPVMPERDETYELVLDLEKSLKRTHIVVDMTESIEEINDKRNNFLQNRDNQKATLDSLVNTSEYQNHVNQLSEYERQQEIFDETTTSHRDKANNIFFSYLALMTIPMFRGMYVEMKEIRKSKKTI